MNKKPNFLMKSKSLPIYTISATLLLFLILIPSAKAENVITTGTTLKVLSGTSLVFIESLVIKTAATLDNAGTVILKKDLTNENASPNSLSSGTAEMSGSTSQSITGQNVFQNLTVNNATGLNIGGNTAVNGNLTLTSGKVSQGISNIDQRILNYEASVSCFSIITLPMITETETET